MMPISDVCVDSKILPDGGKTFLPAKRNIMQDQGGSLKSLFFRYNLPNPEEISVDQAFFKFREVSEAIDEIDRQILEKQKFPDEHTIEWKVRAEKAKWIKEHQRTLLARFLKDKNVDLDVKAEPKVEKVIQQEEVREEPKREVEVVTREVVTREVVARDQPKMYEAEVIDLHVVDSYKFYLLRCYHVLKNLNEEVDFMEKEASCLRDLEKFLERHKMI
jgi:hypothetical protein